MKSRLFANLLAFLVLFAVVLRFIHNYEAWWAQKGRAGYISFQASFFDHSIATQRISHQVLLAALFSALSLWVVFEVFSRAFLLVLNRMTRQRVDSK